MTEARLLGRRTGYAGRVLRVTVDRVELPGGATADLEILRHPGAAVVVPLTDQGQVLLVRQYRHAAGGWLLEVPAGKLDPGEAPKAAPGASSRRRPAGGRASCWPWARSGARPASPTSGCTSFWRETSSPAASAWKTTRS